MVLDDDEVLVKLGRGLRFGACCAADAKYDAGLNDRLAISDAVPVGVKRCKEKCLVKGLVTGGYSYKDVWFRRSCWVCRPLKADRLRGTGIDIGTGADRGTKKNSGCELLLSEDLLKRDLC